MTTSHPVEPVRQAPLLSQGNPQVFPGEAANAVIPVTGREPSVAGIFLIYAWFAVGALILILTLLHAANKHTALYAHRNDTPNRS